MKAHINGNTLYVQREENDPKFYKESAFWYFLKKQLSMFDLVKKVMAKDGHMYGSDTYPYYLRDRKWRFCFYDGNYALRMVYENWNAGEPVELMVEGWT